MLSVCEGGLCLAVFPLVYHFPFSFSPSLRDGPIQTEILSQRAVKPQTNNQSLCCFHMVRYQYSSNSPYVTWRAVMHVGHNTGIKKEH